MSSIDFDKVLVMVGDKGRYQTVMFFILCIPATLPVAFLTFSNVFTNATPDHWCQPPPSFKNLSISDTDLKHLTIPFRIRGDGEKVYSKCTMYDTNSTIYEQIFNIDDRTFNDSDLSGIFDAIVKSDRTFDGKIDSEARGVSSEEPRKRDAIRLNDEWRRTFDEMVRTGELKTVNCEFGWVYDKTWYDDTLVTQLNLVCDSNWLPQTSTALFYVGSLFGNVIFGWVADRWGRRRAMLLMIFLEVFVSIATCFSTDYKTYMIFRALGGFFFPALYQIPFILGIEMMGPSHRTFAGMLICMYFACSMSILALLAYLIRDWFRLSIATSVPFLMLFGYYWIIPESPRWLLSRGRLDEADEILQTMAYYNGTKIPKRLLHKLHEEAINSSTQIIPMNTMDKQRPQNINGSVMNKKTPVVDNHQNYEEIYRRKRNSEHCDKSNSKPLRKSTDDNPDLILDDGSSWCAEKTSTYPLTNPLLKKMNNVAANTEDDKETISISENQGFDGIEEHNRLKDRQNMDINGDSVEDLSRMMPVCPQAETSIVAPKQEATMFDIFRYPNIRKKFFLLTFDWIANAVVYNGLSYNATNLGVNDFLAFFIAAAIEIPSYMLSWWFMDRWGRRLILCIALATGGLGCLSCMFVPEERVWITVVLAMIGKFGVAASFSVFYVFVGELFPTVLRSQAMGLSSLLVSVGLLSFPYILQLSHYSRVLPLIIFGVLSLSGSLVSLFLPETLNTPMPQTLADGENFGKDFKIFSIPKRNKKSDFEP